MIFRASAALRKGDESMAERASKPRGLRKDYSGYVYILPATLSLIIFAIVPIGMAIYFSFTKYNVIQPASWIGLKNYVRLPKDPYRKAAVRNTLLYTLMQVPLTTVLSMMVATPTFFRWSDCDCASRSSAHSLSGCRG